MQLAVEAVLAEAVLYASGGRRLTVEHGQPLTEQATALVRQLVDDVHAAATAADYLGAGTLIARATSLTWTFAPTDLPARDLVLVARHAADRLTPDRGSLPPTTTTERTSRVTASGYPLRSTLASEVRSRISLRVCSRRAEQQRAEG